MTLPGEFLRSSRVARGLSGPQLAKLAGTTAQQIDRLEKSQRKLTREWAERIAPHLLLTPERLLFPEGVNARSAPLTDAIPLADVRAGATSLIKLLLRVAGFPEAQAEAAAPKAAEAFVRVLQDPPEPELGFDRIDAIRFEAEKLIRELARKERQ